MGTTKGITFLTGDMFAYNADIRVNTINCVGVMGAGVALSFKNKYPEMYYDYLNRCKKKEVHPGAPYIWQDNSLFNQTESDIIINFPTKDHWRNPSEYQYIESGLAWMREKLPTFKGKTIAIPSLGCGHGGLEWMMVKQMILSYLKDIEMNILVFEPNTNKNNSNLTDSEISFIREKHIQHITPSSNLYPIRLKGRSETEFFCRGDVNIINDSNSISIFIESNANNRELNAMISCIDELKDKNVTLVLGLVNSKEMDLLKECLLRSIRVILVIPCGIMRMKLRNDIKQLWKDDLITLISLQNPSSSFSLYYAKKTTFFRLQIGKKILINSLDDKTVQYYISHIDNNAAFFIDYWGSHDNNLSKIGATPIRKNRITGLPNIQKIATL